MKRVFFFSCMLFGLIRLGAQQLPMFNQYREYQNIINPASVSHDFLAYELNLSAGLSHRSQWVGLRNSIQTQVARFEWINPRSNIILGAYALRDINGPTQSLGGYLRMAYVLSYDPRETGFSVGLTAGAVQYRINTSEIDFQQDEPLAGNDLVKVYPDVGVGLYYYNTLKGGAFEGDKFYVGLSAPQTFGLDLTYNVDNRDYKVQRVQHFYGTLGMYKYFNDDTYVEPSIWVKYLPNVPVSVDANVRFQIAQLISLGLGYGSSKTLHLEVCVQLADQVGFNGKVLKIGYGFDRGFYKAGSIFGSTHEFNLTYAFANTKRRR